MVLGAAAVFLLMRKLTPSMLARMRSNDRAHYASWWLRTLLMIWLMAQTQVIFLRIEDVSIPQPYSWIRRGFEFLTLGPVSEMFFVPCADVFDYYNTVWPRASLSFRPGSASRPPTSPW